MMTNDFSMRGNTGVPSFGLVALKGEVCGVHPLFFLRDSCSVIVCLSVPTTADLRALGFVQTPSCPSPKCIRNVHQNKAIPQKGHSGEGSGGQNSFGEYFYWSESGFFKGLDHQFNAYEPQEGGYVAVSHSAGLPGFDLTTSAR